MRKEVLVFSSSGTFRGARGVITESARDGAYVQLEGESAPMLFKRGEIVPADRGSHHAGAE